MSDQRPSPSERVLTGASAVAWLGLGLPQSGPVDTAASSHRMIDCDRELRADSAYDQFRCKPEEWTCSCGRRFVHVCDEAEGCGWVLP